MDFEIRDRSVIQGRRPLTREREAYRALVGQGVGNAEACRIVGIHARTGRRWRYARNPTGREAAARIPAARPVRGRYLGEDERLHIADRHREQATVRQIAAELDRDPATISRELRRTPIRSAATTGPTRLTPAPRHAGRARRSAR
jgi:IS30 family transposase